MFQRWESKTTFPIILIAFFGLLTLYASAGWSAEDVPYLSDLSIDGNSSDWNDRGFRVDMMTYRVLDGVAAEDFEPRYRLGWNREGLFFLLQVRDSVPMEEKDIQRVWEKDAVRIAFTPEDMDGSGFIVHIAPGADPESPEPKIYFEQGGISSEPGKVASAVVASSTNPGSYTMEILFPWKNFNLAPSESDLFSLQITVGDIDRRDETIWTSGWNADDWRQFRLARKASPPVTGCAKGSYDRLSKTLVKVCAVNELAGKKVTLLEGEKKLAEAKLQMVLGRAVAEFALPMPSPGETWNGMKAVIRGCPPLPILLPDAREIRARKFAEARIRFSPFVFETSQFPQADFVDSTYVEPLLNMEPISIASSVESLIGLYSLKTTFYDAEYNVVTRAEKPGRYGAVVEIIPESGRTTRRFMTLFHCPGSLNMFKWWTDTDLTASVRFPDALGIDLEPGTKRMQAVDRFFLGDLTLGFLERNGGAALLAGLYESESLDAKAKADYDPFLADRQWWVGFKRKFYGMKDRYPDPFVCPRAAEGKPAMVLHEGTLQEAGMKADAAAKIDAVLKEWSADTDEAFSVCIARHGVIVLHKAYGQRHGAPLTIDTPSWMASITKMMSASLMMLLVDQGLVDLDAPVADYLPPLREVSAEKPLAVRNLYTHTGGLWGHWGDDNHDMEEVVADCGPFLAANKVSLYNGAGNALGSKIIELLSGEALPEFYRKHLLDPLGCTGTEVTGSMGDARSIPLDMAKIGQMLLNGGAYGQYRFMSKETIGKMMPSPMTKQFGPNTSVIKGLGCQWFAEYGLSEKTFGHGAASSATFRIDPEKDLVIVMCRNSAGRDFNVYYPKFITAIVEGIAD